jgi:hypothetical protein
MRFVAFDVEIYLGQSDCLTRSGIVSIFKYGRQTGSTLQLMLYERLTRNSNGDTYVFGVAQSNKVNVDLRQRRPTPEIQNGGRQTGSTCISRCMNDRREIPTTIPMFSGSPSPIKSCCRYTCFTKHCALLRKLKI